MNWKRRYHVSMLERLYVLPEDLALARIPDSQGLGGSTDAAGAAFLTRDPAQPRGPGRP